jgi:hypothetical protein
LCHTEHAAIVARPDAPTPVADAPLALSETIAEHATDDRRALYRRGDEEAIFSVRAAVVT